MSKITTLSPHGAKMFMKKINKYPESKRSKIMSNLRHNSDGSIDFIDAIVIYSLAEDFFTNQEYLHENLSCECSNDLFDSSSSNDSPCNCDCGGCN